MKRFPAAGVYARLSIRAKLYLLIGSCTLALVAATALTVFSISRGVGSLHDVYEHRVEPTAALLEIDTALKEVRFRMAGYLLDQHPAVGNINHLREVWVLVPDAWRRFRQGAATQTLSPADRKLIAGIDVHLANLGPFFDRLEKAYSSDEKSAVAPLLEDEWPLEVHAPLLKPIARLIPVQQAAVKDSYERSLEDGRNLIQAVLAALLAIAGVLAVFAARLATSMTRRLRTAVSVADRVAAGDWSGDVTAGPPDEMGQLLKSIDHMRDQVHTREQRLSAILNNTAEGIITFDKRGIIEGFNQAAERLFGWSESEVLGTSINLLIATDKKDQRDGYLEHFLRNEIQRLVGHEGEVIGRHHDGTIFPMAVKISAMQLEGRHIYIGLLADISERRAMMDRLKFVAEHDGLTGLFNRSYFQQELERVVERAQRRSAHHSALLYIDLDNFKYVNDTLGHAAGDQLIVQIAAVLQKRARKSDILARFGGDEFTVLLDDTDLDNASRVAESFRQQIAGFTFHHEGKHVDVGCSIGVASIHPQTRSATEALSYADLACHLGKRSGRNRIHVFDPADAEKVATMSVDMGWSRRIKAAIENNRFVLACQPIVHTGTREIDAYETLIRLRDEHDEIIMPSGFLPAAERFGLASDIDMWVIARAIDTLAHLRETQPRARYSINLSALTLMRDGLVDFIASRLVQRRLDPEALTFEVTETAAITDMNAAGALLSALRQLGCRTALDDFGSGMSSFAYLRELPVDFVKIDGRFVKNLATSPVDQAMVKAMNEIAHALGKQTIAEFVENEESFRLLSLFGVDYAQGYHLGRPELVAAPPVRMVAAGSGDTARMGY
jgi:diguanylate cyclase (GGDEF)-like protein/PAS domain S-box-containing protein